MARTDLADKVAIVTGGGRGTGRAMALGLANYGANVIVTAARNLAEAEAVAAQARSETGRDCMFAIAADVASEADCARVVETALANFGGIHILVNNAGRGMRFVSEDFLERPTKFWETDPATWRMIIDTNVNGPFLMARAIVPRLLRNGWGRIVNITMNQETMRRVGFSPYGPSKAALESETIIWSQDLADTGITVNALSPGGITDTGMVPDAAREKFRRVMLDPEVMVAPLIWLCSRQADSITGHRYVAKDWDPLMPPEAAAARARTTAGWP
jgi:NAD(P)-dependent dehydrogenase (short-subunit alcohol dehydrogenase family)